MKYIVKYCNIINPAKLTLSDLETAKQVERELRILDESILTRIVTLEDDEVEEVPLEAEPPEEQHISWWKKFKRLLIGL